jgi:hypothetical protein
MQIQLGVIYCGQCRTQLVSHICTISGTDKLVCIFCAQEIADTGRAISPVYPPTGWGGMGLAEALDPIDAIALLVRNGATIIES